MINLSGSGIGSGAKNPEQLTNGTKWLSGKRLGGDDSQDTVMKWVNGLDLEIDNMSLFDYVLIMER